MAELSSANVNHLKTLMAMYKKAANSIFAMPSNMVCIKSCGADRGAWGKRIGLRRPPWKAHPKPARLKPAAHNKITQQLQHLQHWSEGKPTVHNLNMAHLLGPTAPGPIAIPFWWRGATGNACTSSLKPSDASSLFRAPRADTPASLRCMSSSPSCVRSFQVLSPGSSLRKELGRPYAAGASWALVPLPPSMNRAHERCMGYVVQV